MSAIIIANASPRTRRPQPTSNREGRELLLWTMA
jgi:hypothetical protein